MKRQLDSPDFRALLTVVTEITDQRETALTRFVLHWGDLGGRWGVNRSISQIHAILYVASRPLTAEEIAEALGIARSNVSTSLRELQGWGLVRRVPIQGERRDHFEAETDVWEIAARIIAGRKTREIDPALATLRACVVEAETDPAVDATARARLRAMLEFTETMDGWYAQMLRVPRPKLLMLVRLGAKVVSLLPGGDRKR